MFRRKDEVRDQCIALIDEDEAINETAGKEWPSDEIEGVAREREFYQVCNTRKECIRSMYCFDVRVEACK